MEKRSFLSLIALVAGWMSVPSISQAFTFSPMSIEFEPSGPSATRSFLIENDGDTPAAIEFSIVPRQQDSEGQEKLEKDPAIEKKFLLYPPQVLLQPKEKRTLRVSWIGDANPARELAYRIVAEQLPVKTQKDHPGSAEARKSGAAIQMLLRYIGAIYIKPKDAKPNLVLKSTEVLAQALEPDEPRAGAKGKSKSKLRPKSKSKLKPKSAVKAEPPKLALVFENTGTAHQILAGIELKISSASQPPTEVVYKPVDIPEVSSQNVLAGGARRFVLPWPKGLPPGPVQVQFELKR